MTKLLSLRGWILGFFWTLAFTGTHFPHAQVPGGFSWGDKVVHGTMFFVLASLLLWALPDHLRPRWRRVTLVLGVLLVYAIFDETTQPMFGRDRDFLDGMADMAGATLASIVFFFLPRR